MPTITVSREALEAAVDGILFETFEHESTACRNLDTPVAECGGGCRSEMEFLRAARDAGVSIEARIERVRPGGEGEGDGSLDESVRLFRLRHAGHRRHHHGCGLLSSAYR